MNTHLVGKTIAHFNSYDGEIAIAFTDGTQAVINGSVHSIELPPRRAAGDDRNSVIRKRIQCADGHSISVQASAFHYSQPRENRYFNLWLYDAVECGFPELPDGTVYRPAELEKYREYDSDIYPYTPIGVVAAYVQAHGGAVSGGEIIND